ncbi:GntR family transcriptional regulator [Oceanomicrobium pacificus]|uniref:UTRA domain-containing protein n=1 Tax=Oceanomicrobium pacificus TaxID=2692916 RepID=A0A6B0TRX9_9RHOB|nr:GntR family transcriptional regulator [Oceanomicrobium pacificus]MXU66736.1 UTRA domain-containing protein [Oceanomicrobium pacificus]
MSDITSYLAPAGWLTGSGGPRYLQLRRRIQDAIADGVISEGDPLPSEREIAALTDLSRVTVRKAVAELVEAGTIIQRRGSGSFVAPNVARVEQSLSRLTSFTEDMARRGMEVESTFIERRVCPPSPQETFTLGLSAGELVARVARLRRADGRPLAIERASLPNSILPNPTDVDHSLYAVLDRMGLRPVRAVQRISAINIRAEDAELLDIPAGAAALKIERVSYLDSGRVVEFTRSIYRGDAYDFVAELQLSGT